MKNIKEIILKKAKALFNQYGVASVSFREIAREVGISHSNLIYHFKDRNILIRALHQQISESAMALNGEIKKEENILKRLFVSTVKGFGVLVDFSFFMVDLNFIVKGDEVLHGIILEVEELRFSMYEEVIAALVDNGTMRKEDYDGEYAHLIIQVRIFSDYWLSSARIYESGDQGIIEKYARLFLLLFYPYLTEKGKCDFNGLCKEFRLCE